MRVLFGDVKKKTPNPIPNLQLVERSFPFVYFATCTRLSGVPASERLYFY
jgi:hypothetical protein